MEAKRQQVMHNAIQLCYHYFFARSNAIGDFFFDEKRSSSRFPLNESSYNVLARRQHPPKRMPTKDI
jgi:hypothetical protein